MVNSQIRQLADGEFFYNDKDYTIFVQKTDLMLTLTLSSIDSVNRNHI